MQKILSLAFVWHMHQPNYQAQPGGIRLMPWVRLHAIKDYLDMLIYLDKFPDLKLNFNLVPALLDALEDYSEHEGHDIHSKLTVTPIEELSIDDKQFVLNYFFDANYTNLIAHHPYYSELYQRRFVNDDTDIEDFSDEEYSDIMMWYSLVWFDPVWREHYPEIDYWCEKEKNFTLEDRQRIIQIQREIISKIIPEFKKYQDNNRIELTTSPYYHPILPIMFDGNIAKKSAIKHPLPDCRIHMSDDAKRQVKMALDKMEAVFGRRPTGIWPSEHCVSPRTLECFADLGVKWTITDEGILAKSLKKEFVRDFKGVLEDPYDLCNIYNFQPKNKDINIIFRDSVIPNLIAFEYPHHDSEMAAKDLYSRIKTIQNKLQNSPDNNHLLAIAMDGENSWESYSHDGSVFLNTLYQLISDDKTLDTVTVSEYVERIPSKSLAHLSSGSWINRDFQLWIAEPTKNLAWKYLVQTYNDLKEFEKTENIDESILTLARKELYIAQGSDWFWWYGEPNDSGQDHIFDYLFREHLKNVYILLNKTVPPHLESPLISFIGKPSRAPKKQITPQIDGRDEHDDWHNAGCIDIPAGPIPQENKLFNRICFGCDNHNVYLMFDINKFAIESNGTFKSIFQAYIYFKTYNDNIHNTGPIRPLNKPDNILPILKDGYTHEVKITFVRNNMLPIQSAYAIENNLWAMQLNNSIYCVYDEIMEVRIPFDDLNARPGDKVDFFIINGALGQTEEVYPQDVLLSIERPAVISSTLPVLK